eukprot:gnl/Hemi2/10048_TR3478_c0_g1_i1.p1 gnl/Hemi2/10048_TR3478_c0_g1~~gnl/Hemi2/10048_TR3478_c0_g1_i1.p1  ORF type:complete len:463 (-),score=82.89 gnl/Hemi2/10048_TR3478_c0_g1_i1:66-1400(-)
MGKDKTAVAKQRKARRHDPLEKDITQQRSGVKQAKQKLKKAKKGADDDEDETFITPAISRRILQAARSQQEEVAMEEPDVMEPVARLGDSDDESEDGNDTDEEEYNQRPMEINEDDERALEAFMTSAYQPPTTLGDVIMQKLREKEASGQTGAEGHQTFDPKILEVYAGVASVLKTYRSGPLPRAFKIIPTLAEWEDVLFLTNPEEWSPQATSRATRIFSGNLKDQMAQRYYNLVILPKVRQDMHENKKLNFHYYYSLRKAAYKAPAFYKGIVLPLVESGNCTLREAVIVSSVIRKKAVPMLHSAAALLKLAEMDYAGAASVFIRTLVDKKYSLPFTVIDALVAHFCRAGNDPRALPLLWHTALLTVVQRYKEQMTPEEKEALKQLLRVHFHQGTGPHQQGIGHEIRRELFAAKASRNEPQTEDGCVAMGICTTEPMLMQDYHP